jgi:FtsP/CotA-like multicopper oxidase with cupredoxin domain
MVPPGAKFTYEWEVPERAGPGPEDPSSIVWLYHSHVNEYKDVAAGLVGPIIVGRRGQTNTDGTPKDVDREIVALFAAFNENQSWYVDQNVAAHISAPDRKTLKTVDAKLSDPHMYVAFGGNGFAETNFKFSVNGYLYGNGPVMTMKQGQRVRWYVLDVGDVANFHTPHWLGGNLVTYHHARTDVFSMVPAGMETADMVPDTAGLWLLHCQVDDHHQAGMVARYEVLPAQAAGGRTP